MDDVQERPANTDGGDELKAIIGRLETEAKRRVARKTHIEDRWIEDLRQYHGQYDEDTQRKLKSADRSKLFLNMTRVKCGALEARLEDMLFPTDDKNWGVEPTPVPELAQEAEKATQAAKAAREQATQAAEAESPQAPQMAAAADSAEAVAGQIQAQMDEARQRAEAMETEIDDCLEQSRWPSECRDMIADGVRLGCGVVKGPVLNDRASLAWRPGEGGEFELQSKASAQPSLRRVDPWGFFPDPDARTIEEGEGVYERHLLKPQGLRKLARLPGFNVDAVRRLLVEKPKHPAPSYLSELRDLGGDEHQITGDMFLVWEYSGPLAAEDLEVLYAASGDEAGAREAAQVDPLDEVNVVIWFAEGEVLKVGPYPLDSGECLYSVFSLQPEEASIYGKGLPAIMRDEQSALNASWRMMFDNAGAGAGPQIVVDDAQVEPMDGDWTMKPFKTWRRKADAPASRSAPFEQISFDMSLGDLERLLMLSVKMIDDVTALPAMAQGEQGAGVTRTAQGMALLMSSSNVVFRRIVKMFDDHVIVPTIRRFYHWHMQFSPKNYIKGDYEVSARGSSVLMVREMQAQNLMTMATIFAGHPVFGPMLRDGGLPLMRKIIAAHMIAADEIALSKEEYEEFLSQQAGAEDPMAMIEMEKLELEREKMAMQAEIANMDADTRRFVAQSQQETAMMRAAEGMNLKDAELAVKERTERAKSDGQERRLAAEIGMAERTGVSSGGAV